MIFTHIEKRHGDRVLLNIDSLQVRPGRNILFIGDNGSGKTSLLKILAGLLVPDRGQVTLDDNTMSWHKARAQILERFVYVHQTPYMFDGTVTDNIIYGLKATGTPGPQIEQRAADALHWSGLDHLAYRNARHLSRGEQQRVAIARAKVLAREVLALDEPTANLDRKSRNQTYEMIEKLHADGITALIASHDVGPLAAICAQHWQLQSGRLVSWKAGTQSVLRRGNVRPFPRRRV